MIRCSSCLVTLKPEGMALTCPNRKEGQAILCLYCCKCCTEGKRFL